MSLRVNAVLLWCTLALVTETMLVPGVRSMAEGLPFARARVWFLRLLLIPVAVICVLFAVLTPPDAVASPDMTNFVAVTLPFMTVLKLLQVVGAWWRHRQAQQPTPGA
jgi:hypothetical protein